MILTPEALEALRGQLMVSCQAHPGEPMRGPRTIAQIAAAAVTGGAAASRVQGLADVQFTRAAVESHALVMADCGSFDDVAAAVVVGTAITHPATITGWFAEALR